MKTPLTYLAAAVIWALGVAPLAAQDTPQQLSCEFGQGTSTSYEKGTFTAKPASALAFKLSEIDLEGQSAQLSSTELKEGGSQKPVSVRIVRAINANHFLEVVNEGFLNLTTVYDMDASTGSYPAVHSRHFGFLGQPVFAQYTGTCRAG